MWTVDLSWADWRAVIAALRGSGIDYSVRHADLLERKLEEHGPGEATVRLSLNDDVFLRSVVWALHELGLPASVYRKGE